MLFYNVLFEVFIPIYWTWTNLHYSHVHAYQYVVHFEKWKKNHIYWILFVLFVLNGNTVALLWTIHCVFVHVTEHWLASCWYLYWYMWLFIPACWNSQLNNSLNPVNFYQIVFFIYVTDCWLTTTIMKNTRVNIKGCGTLMLSRLSCINSLPITIVKHKQGVNSKTRL